MKQPIRILGICLLMLAANLVAQATRRNRPHIVVRRFSCSTDGATQHTKGKGPDRSGPFPVLPLNLGIAE